MPAGLGITEQVRRAGVGDGVAGAAARADRDVVVGVAFLGTKQLQLRLLDILGIGKRGIRQAGDVRAARTDVADLAPAHAHHAAACDADHAHVERVDVSVVAANPGVLHRRPAVADDTDVGAGAADFEVDAVGDFEIHERAGHAGSRSRQHGHGGTAAHLSDVHHTAIASHDHQRCLDARLAHAGFRHIRRGDHLGQDARIDHCGAGSRRQPIQLADLVPAGRGYAHRGGRAHHQLFTASVVDSEGTARHHDLDAFGAKLLQHPTHRLLVENIRGQKAMRRPQTPARRQLDLLDAALAPGQQRLHAARHSENAHRGHVTFQQRVGRLSGAVCQEHDIPWLDPRALEHVAEHFDHTARHAACVAVGRQHRVALHHLERRVVDQHRLGEGPADVDADTVALALIHPRSRDRQLWPSSA